MKRACAILGILIAAAGAMAAGAAAGGSTNGKPASVEALFQEGRFHEVFLAMHERLLLFPHDTAAQRNVARAAFGLGDYKGAASFSAIILNDHPGDAWAGMVFSLSILFLGSEADAHEAQTMLELGRLCVTAGDYASASGFYRNYLALNPDDAVVRKECARMLSWSRQGVLSANEYLRYLEQHPEDEEVRLELARLLNQTGNYRAATDHLGLLLAANPSNVRARLELVRTCAWEGNNPACAKAMAALAGVTNGLTRDDLVFLADQAARLGKPTEETGFLEGADRLAPGSPEIQKRLAHIRASEGRPVAAGLPAGDLRDFQALGSRQLERLFGERTDLGASWAARHPGDVASAWEAGRLAEELGRREKALALYRQIAAAGVPLVDERIHHAMKSAGTPQGGAAAAGEETP